MGTNISLPPPPSSTSGSRVDIRWDLSAKSADRPSATCCLNEPGLGCWPASMHDQQPSALRPRPNAKPDPPRPERRHPPDRPPHGQRGIGSRRGRRSPRPGQPRRPRQPRRRACCRPMSACCTTGLLVPNQTAETVLDAGALLVIDARRGYGQRMAADAVRRAIARAKELGACVLAFRNSSHIGRIGTYAELAASERLRLHRLRQRRRPPRRRRPLGRPPNRASAPTRSAPRSQDPTVRR